MANKLKVVRTIATAIYGKLNAKQRSRTSIDNIQDVIDALADFNSDPVIDLNDLVHEQCPETQMD